MMCTMIAAMKMVMTRIRAPLLAFMPCPSCPTPLTFIIPLPHPPYARRCCCRPPSAAPATPAGVVGVTCRSSTSYTIPPRQRYAISVPEAVRAAAEEQGGIHGAVLAAHETGCSVDGADVRLSRLQMLLGDEINLRG